LLGTVDKLTGVIEITDAFGVYFKKQTNKAGGQQVCFICKSSN